MRSMAGATGLEPAASGVTGRRSNQLSYAPSPADQGGHSYICTRSVSSKGGARQQRVPAVVGDEGFEPPTPSV